MTPAAHMQAIIETLHAVDKFSGPASHEISRYFRGRRYVGAKDRRKIRDLVFDIVRDQIRLDWYLERAGVKTSPRSRTLIKYLLDGHTTEEIVALCNGSKYSPSPLGPTEHKLISSFMDMLPQLKQTEPGWVRGNYPLWLEPELQRTWGDSLLAEVSGLDSSAPTDLRVNEAKATRDEILESLRTHGFNAIATPYASSGIRVFDRPAITRTKEYRNGLFELQDEGAQLATNLVNPEPNHCIIDFCAGAGGKTLPLAARLNCRGKIIACDTSSARLENMKPRIKRAKLRNVERHVLVRNDPWLRKLKGEADRVLVDTPCSGTGTWRREPDARCRLNPSILKSYILKQREILDQASQLVRPGGRLIYSTCSILTSENSDQIEYFLRKRKEFSLSPIGPIWRETVGTIDVPEQSTLQLTPNRHGVDGFFVAVLTRAF